MPDHPTQFATVFQQLRTNLWYANRYHLENNIKAETLHLDMCINHCIALDDQDSKMFRREIYPFLPNSITDKLLLNLYS